MTTARSDSVKPQKKYFISVPFNGTVYILNGVDEKSIPKTIIHPDAEKWLKVLSIRRIPEYKFKVETINMINILCASLENNLETNVKTDKILERLEKLFANSEADVEVNEKNPDKIATPTIAESTVAQHTLFANTNVSLINENKMGFSEGQLKKPDDSGVTKLHNLHQ